MADADINGHPPLPPGLLEALAAEPPAAAFPNRIMRARDHIRSRAFEDSVVVEEIASQLLLLSD